MRAALFGSLMLFLVGCTPAAPPATPAPPAATTAPPAVTTPPVAEPVPVDPFAVPADLRSEPATAPAADEAPPALPAARKDVRGPDKACKAWVQRRGAKAAACKDKAAALTALDEALSEGNAEKRDAALAGLEACDKLPAGLVRALRADFAPTECADVLVEPLLSKPPKGVTPAVLQVLTGHALAGRLARLGSDIPVMKPPYEKKLILEHIKGPVARWLISQTSAIEEISQAGAKLAMNSYGRALVATEAGMADMRLVDSARSMPTPKEWDQELRDIYIGALEEVMEPRKARGRDAALLGLGSMASLGVIADPRLEKARGFLSKLYRGRRIDALDGLLLPALPAAASKTIEQKLAAKLPTFYASQLLDPAAMSDAGALRAWIERGLPFGLRASLRDASLSPEQRRLVAQARAELGRRYWRRFDFDEIIALASKEPQRSDEMTLLMATALALRGGPEHAADMMRNGTMGKMNVAALDKFGASSSPLAPLAAYNAAYLMSLAPPENADEAYWRGVEQRFTGAASRLGDPKLKERAEQEARQAGEIAGAIKGKLRRAPCAGSPRG